MTLRAPFQMVRSQTPPVVEGGIMDKDWYRFLVSLYNAVTQGLPQAEETIPLAASPFVYQAVIRGQIHVSGGTVSAVEFSRDGTNYYGTGLTNGFVQMDQRDYVRITYAVAPLIKFFPM